MSVSNGVTSAVPGGAAVYLVTVRNAGPSSVSSLSLTDVASAALRNVVYAPASGSYKASTHLWSGLSLGSGRSVTMLVAGTVDPAASGALANTVTVAPPTGTTDTNATNNTATDTDTLVPVADLSVGLSDGVTSLVAGRSTVYTVTVRNNGLSTVGSLSLTDTSPSSLTGLVFAPASGSYSPGTHLWSGLTLAAGQSVSMTVTGTVAATAAGSLLNAATVAPPAGVIDPISGNNSASDSDKLTAQADLSITNSDGAATAEPGLSTTYTVVVSNPGPSTAAGATVSDTLPAAVSSDTWTGPNGTSGTGSIHATVTVPAGGTVTYTIVAAVGAAATGTLADTATVTAPAGLTDSNTANNSATDTDALNPTADLQVSNSDGAGSVTAGTSTSYTVTVKNTGPSTVAGATVADAIPAGINSFSWTGSDGTSGSGAINATVTLAPAASVTYTVAAAVDTSATGSIVDIATVTAPAGVSDPIPANNSATDTDTVSSAGIIVTGRVKLGDLYLCNLSSLTDPTFGTALNVFDMDGHTVRQFLAIVEQKLGGGSVPSTDSFAGLDTLTADIELAFENGVPLSFFADGHLSTRGDCAPVNWQPNQIISYGQSSFAASNGGLEPSGVLDYLFENVYSGPTVFELDVGDTADPGGYTLSFTSPGDITNLLPTAGPPGALTESSFASNSDEVDRSAGVFGGDVVALALDVAFSDSYAPRTCSPPGSANSSGSIVTGIPCPWGLGDMLTFGQVGWSGNPLSLLDRFGTVENHGLLVGDPAGNHIELTSAAAVKTFLTTSGPDAALTGTFVDPARGATGTGVFGGDLVALQLDVDYSDAGLIPNNTGLNFGNLTLCNVPGFTDLNGDTVRQFLAIANAGLAGEATGHTLDGLASFTSALGVAFAGTLPSPTASDLYNGPCPASGTEAP